jgi:antitoxin (DNA-binding transcriptional repressor) of toxin-antitoxin stability system
MAAVGIRELKNNLSRFVRRVERGERVAVTAHGRVVAELGPPRRIGQHDRPSRLAALAQAGVLRPPVEAGDPLAVLPQIRLPRGAAARLIEADRDGT